MSTVQLITAHIKYSFLVRRRLVTGIWSSRVQLCHFGMAFTGLHPLLTSDVIPSSNFRKLSAKNTLLAVVVKHSQYMYNSFPALCRNTAGSNCILILSNLTAGIHVYINYEAIWKITSNTNAFLNLFGWSEQFGNYVKRANFA